MAGSVKRKAIQAEVSISLLQKVIPGEPGLAYGLLLFSSLVILVGGEYNPIEQTIEPNMRNISTF